VGQDAILKSDPMSVQLVTDLFGCHSLALHPVSLGNKFMLVLYQMQGATIMPQHAGHGLRGPSMERQGSVMVVVLFAVWCVNSLFVCESS
jgi:hypothetical protein